MFYVAIAVVCLVSLLFPNFCWSVESWPLARDHHLSLLKVLCRVIV